MHILIGIDLGTTNIKVSAFSTDGRLIHCAARPTPTFSHPDGSSEFDPEGIWLNLLSCLKETLPQCGNRVAVIGISSFGESNVLLDDQHRPVYPSITWYDPRTVAQAQFLAGRISVREVHASTGQFLSPKLGICKVMWVRDNHPELFAHAACCLSMPDFIAHRMTGQAGMDYTMASRMMLLDLHSLDYSDKILNAADLPRTLFPPIRPSGVPAGVMRSALLTELGLDPGSSVPVVVCGHDHSCAAIAAHIFEEGTALDSMGTAETIVVASDELPSLDHCFRHQVSVYPHFGKSLYRMSTSIQACGAALNWAESRLFDSDPSLAPDLPALNRYLSEAEGLDKASCPIFCPNIRGLQESPTSYGAFLGLRDITTKAHLAYAVAEGLAFEGYRRLHACIGGAGREVRQLRVVGGPASLAPLIHMKAAILGCEVQLPIIHDSACYGAALIAGVSVGILQDYPPLVFSEVFHPDEEQRKAFMDRYQAYEKAINWITAFP